MTNKPPFSLTALSGLTEIDQIIKSRLHSEASIIETVSTYLLGLGGKRIRPVLTVLCAQALGLPEPFESTANGAQLLKSAAGIELIHMATLLHDDIIDRSLVRRHKESAWARFGTEHTLLAGDFLLVRAFGLSAHLDKFLIDSTEVACIALTEGETMETALPLAEHTVDSSLDIARKKTASLFRLAARSAAWLSGCDERAIENMTVYGEKIGVAFQIVDDILDIISTEEILGKRPGQDLRERKPSIVNVLWLKSGSPLARQLLATSSEMDNQFVQNALLELKGSAIIENARKLAADHCEKATSALRLAVSSSMKDCSAEQEKSRLSALNKLIELSDFVMERMA